MQNFDSIIIGAGAAGLFCAGVAAQRGLKVLVIDHATKIAEKIRVSGGGRCNFTNLQTNHTHFISQNSQFCRSALSQYTPHHFIDLLQRHRIAFHEKHKGQLFCDNSADDIIQMLLKECAAGAMGGSVTRWHGCRIHAINFSETSPHSLNKSNYLIQTEQGLVSAPQLVIATGGLSIPKIGASDLGYRIAQQFNLRCVATRPALVPLTFNPQLWQPYSALAGLALPVLIATGDKKNRMEFAEDLLFTHRGLSGPAVLQISSFWQEKTAIRLNLAPDANLREHLQLAKKTSRKRIANELASLMPARLADTWTTPNLAWQRPINEASDKALEQLVTAVTQWEITPNGTEGYPKAEVTLGGIDTRDLSSQTMESKQPGLYFIGEVVDVTGWLGGYNFQWAWASGFACGQALRSAA